MSLAPVNRSFTSRDPVAEYKLDVKAAHAQLLVNYRRKALEAVFRGPATAPPPSSLQQVGRG